MYRNYSNSISLDILSFGDNATRHFNDVNNFVKIK